MMISILMALKSNTLLTTLLVEQREVVAQEVSIAKQQLLHPNHAQSELTDLVASILESSVPSMPTEMKSSVITVKEDIIAMSSA
jgi:hypothetical protein